MARPIRVEFPGAWYHVTDRGNARQAIFCDNHDRQKYLACLGQNIEEFNVRCHAFVLMDNHIHLVLETLEGNLGRFMQRLNTSYTGWFNHHHETCGHLFQGRYKAILVDAEDYLQTVGRYVHLNPVRVAAAENIGADEKRQRLRDHLWSSYRGYGRLRGRPEWLTCQEILSAWGGDTARGREKYREYVEEGVLGKAQNPFKDVKEQFFLGGQAFVDWVYETHLRKRKGSAREQPQLVRLRPTIGVSRIASEVAAEYDMDKEALLAARKHTGAARQMLIVLALEFRDRAKSLRSLADELGGVSVSALDNARVRFMERLKGTPRLCAELERVKTRLKSE